MAKVRDLVTGSLRALGVVDPGEAVDANQAAAALQVLNEMLEAWNLESLMIYTVSQATYSLTANKRDYALGPTATSPDWTATRPVKVKAAGLLVGTLEYPLELLEDQEWESISLKSLSTSLPRAIYNRGDWPNTTISVWPVPATAYQIVIYSQQNLTGFASLDDTVSLPPGYSKALRTNLSVELASEYGIQPSPVLMKIAQESKAAVKRRNSTPPLLRVDQAMLGGPRFGNISDFLGGK